MPALILELSKYIFIILMVFYIGLTFIALRKKDDDFRKAIYYFCEIITLIFYLLGMANLIVKALNQGDYDAVKSLGILGGMEFALLIFLPLIMRIIYRDVNNLLLCQMEMMMAIGFIMLARLNRAHAKRQFIIIAVSCVMFLIIPVLIRKLDFLRKLTWVYGGVGIAGLGIVLIAGNVVNGSKLNFNVFGLIFQPSEMIKLMFAFCIAGLLYKAADLKNVLISAAMAGVHVLILVASKDLGSALIYFVMYVAMVYVASGKQRYLLAGLIGGLFAAVIAYTLFSHVKLRVQIWLDPFSDPDNKGYQLCQSLFGISTGGWFGMGLGHGAPGVIPFVEADFIFSAVAEELGVLFGMLLILLCLSIVLGALVMAVRIKDPFYRLVAVGLSVCYGVQVILTIGGGTGFIPLTGVTLPLVSNGGTSALITIALFGILQGIYMIRMDEFDADEAEREEYDEKLERWERKRQKLYDEGYSEEQIERKEAAFFAKEDERDEEREPEILNKKKQDRCIFINGLIYSLVFLLMFANIVRFIFIKGDESMVNSYNSKRMAILEQDNLRGNIYAADGTVLAYTDRDDKGNNLRHYPYGELYAHTVGFASNGGLGIERTMQKYLITSDVSLAVKMGDDLNQRPHEGNNVYTTLDPGLQQVAFDAIGDHRGAVVVTEASSGRILAMVSKPGFDPNQIDVIWDALLEDDESGKMVNRASQGQYPPGSTFKILTALEYIRENPDDYEAYDFNCNGRFTSDEGITIQCYHGSVHGEVDLKESFAKSCNSSFANIALKLDRGKFADTLLGLAFNKEMDLQVENNFSKISIRSDLTNEKLMQTAIGQAETVMNPLHLNMITQTIANGGVMMKPYIIEKVAAADGSILQRYKPEKYGPTIAKNEVDIMTDMMKAVVDHGTATRIKDLPFEVAGKTGSAEFSNNKHQSHAWFTGFAPADDPEIVVTVILENAGSGGEMAAPIAGKLFSRYFTDHAGD